MSSSDKPGSFARNCSPGTVYRLQPIFRREVTVTRGFANAFSSGRKQRLRGLDQQKEDYQRFKAEQDRQADLALEEKLRNMGRGQGTTSNPPTAMGIASSKPGTLRIAVYAHTC